MFIFSHSCYWHIKLLQMLYFNTSTCVKYKLITLIIFVFIIGRIGQRCLFLLLFCSVNSFLYTNWHISLKNYNFLKYCSNKKGCRAPKLSVWANLLPLKYFHMMLIRILIQVSILYCSKNVLLYHIFKIPILQYYSDSINQWSSTRFYKSLK